MITVRSNDAILFRNGGFHTDGDSFLAIVQVTETSDELGFVERIGGDFHASHQGHVAEEGHEFLRVGFDGA